MPEWVIWAIAAAALAAGEILTLGFFLGLMALGAAVAAIAAAVGLSVELQVALFAVTSVASLAFIRSARGPSCSSASTPTTAR
jgi:membrane protein implicated in regulation of membrane protease activity